MIDKLKGKLLPWQKMVLGFCVIVLCTWLFHLYTTPEARAWQNDSEGLVWGKIVRFESGIQDKSEFLLLGNYGHDDPAMNQRAFVEGTPPQDQVYSIYPSQTGAQGLLFLFLSQVFTRIGIDRYHVQRLLWILNTSAFVLCFAFVCRWIAEKWGGISALFALSVLVASHWMTVSISNLYWVTWTMLLPMAITAEWCREKSNTKSKKYLIALGLAFLFRFMCGFEFVSTVMWCSEVPLFLCFAESFSDPVKRKKYLRKMFAVGIVALSMFVVALGIWFVELCVCGGWHWAINRMLETVAKRTGAFENMFDLSNMEGVEESLAVSRLSVVAIYLQSQKLWGILGIKEIVFLEIILKAINCFQNRKSRESIKIEISMLVFSALAPISWFFLASGHAYVHTHIDHLLWLFPFVPICLAYIGKNAVEIMKNFEVKQRPSLEG